MCRIINLRHNEDTTIVSGKNLICDNLNFDYYSFFSGEVFETNIYI